MKKIQINIITQTKILNYFINLSARFFSILDDSLACINNDEVSSISARKIELWLFILAFCEDGVNN